MSEKNKKSIVVFNTPAYGGYHGWKSGEYLAMVKAIISIPLINDHAVPFKPGKNIQSLSGEKKNLRMQLFIFIEMIPIEKNKWFISLTQLF